MDRIMAPIRRRWPIYLWTCPRCVSVWAGIGVTVLLVVWPWANWPFAFSWLYIAYADASLARRYASYPPLAGGSDILAASCSQADVTTAYNSAVDGDVIVIPTGDCVASNQWSSRLVVTKKVTFRGAGQGQTKIGITAAGNGFRLQADNVNITAMTLDCGNFNTSNQGIILIGDTNGCPTLFYKDWRIHHNIFDRCGAVGGNVTGYNGITIAGSSYGLIDHNTVNDGNGEFIDISQDGVAGIGRDNTPGLYDVNRAVFVEDNTFNANQNVLYENAIDGNSAQRFVFRHNVINFTNSARYASGIVSTHETCALGTGLSGSCGDAGSMAYEMYENTVNLGSTGIMRDLGIARGGRALIYNNHITFTGSSVGRYDVGSWISNYRSYFRYGGPPTICLAATHARGFSGSCHEVDGGFTTEGLDANKTTLNGAILSTDTTITLTSSSGFNSNGAANGFGITIDSEQIEYTGVSGNQLTGCTRGVNGTTAAAHSNGANVNYLKFGICLEQVNNVYIWNNDINGAVTGAMNDVNIVTDSDLTGPDYTTYDIQSFAQRPNNWQYRTGSAFSYTPYPYPHPLQGITIPGGRAHHVRSHKRWR